MREKVRDRMQGAVRRTGVRRTYVSLHPQAVMFIERVHYVSSDENFPRLFADRRGPRTRFVGQRVPKNSRNAHLAERLRNADSAQLSFSRQTNMDKPKIQCQQVGLPHTRTTLWFVGVPRGALSLKIQVFCWPVNRCVLHFY
jgi:hypothetical protein